MLINFALFTVFSLSFLASFSQSSPYFNISHFLYPFSDAFLDEELHGQPQPPPFFRGVLEAIADKGKWELGDVRIFNLDFKKSMFGDVKRYEFRVPFGKNEFVFKLLDQVSRWKRIQRVENESEFEELIREINTNAVLDTFEIQGPFHLLVSGHDELTLTLPMNASFAGLKHIYIREGITAEIKGAKEVSLSRSIDPHGAVNRSDISSFRYFKPSVCMALPSIRIVGSATVVAFRTQNSEAQVETRFLSKRVVELQPEKCYSQNFYRRWHLSIDSPSASMTLLDKFMQSFVGQKMNKNGGSGSGFLSAKIIASSLFRFQVEVERDIHSNDSHWSKIPDWRTKPTVEHLLYEVVARIETDVLKPLIVAKIKTFIQVDSKDWSNLMANVSFTNFPSILVPQEALTLGVKW